MRDIPVTELSANELVVEAPTFDEIADYADAVMCGDFDDLDIVQLNTIIRGFEVYLELAKRCKKGLEVYYGKDA